MNKKELIERIKKLPFSYIWDEPYLNKEVVLEAVEQLDEPQKVVVPQFVADWYEENEDDFEFNVWDWIAFRNEPEKLKNKEFNYWINDGEGNPIQTLAKMHQFGYEVEKEPKYTVRVKGICGNHETLNREKHSNKWLFSDREENSLYGTHHTRNQLEDAGFGWVFDCPGIEIEEVE
jgi:gp178